MATTLTNIANAALVRVGLPIISNLTDGTNSANFCNERILDIVDQVLASFPWDCASTRVVLAPSSAAPAFDYTYAFPKPADCLRVIDVSSDPRGSDVALGDRPRYKIEGPNILFDCPVLYLRYVYRVTDPAMLDSNCSQAISLRLSQEICQVLVKNESLNGLLEKQYDKTLKQAENISSQQETRVMIIDRFERARFWGPG